MNKKLTTSSIIYPGVLIVIFFYLRFRIDPSLYVIAQEPVFQWRWEFFSDFLSLPGGMVGWIAALLSQLFIYPYVGAAIIAALLLAIAAGTNRLLCAAGVARGRLPLSLIPALLFLALQGNYYHPLSVTIGFALAFWTAVGYCCAGGGPLRTLLFAALAGALFFLAGGVMLLFALIVFFYEIFSGGRKGAACLHAMFAGTIPWAAAHFFMLVSTHDAYLQALPLEPAGYKPGETPVFALAAVPALMAVAGLAAVAAKKLPAGRAGGAEKSWLNSFSPSGVIGTVAGIAITLLFIVPSCSRSDRLMLRICRESRDGEWERIYRECLQSSIDTWLSGSALGQALYYGGLLPTDLFAVPQRFGDHALLLYGNTPSDPFNLDPFLFIYRAELFGRMGLVNEAEQWAYESIGLRGETPRALRLLALIHAAKGEFRAARTCLTLLGTMPPESHRAEQSAQRVADPAAAAADPEIRALREIMPVNDYIRASVAFPCSDIEAAVRQHRPNRMAFEYCMASYLLQGNLKKIASLADFLGERSYPSMPRLYQEALVMLASTEPALLPAAAKEIDPQTIADYVSFNRILMKYQGDFSAADHELVDRYWNSYWYYCFHDLLPRKRK
jgi:hypothetical protein